jgi:hypothetical protein
MAEDFQTVAPVAQEKLGLSTPLKVGDSSLANQDRWHEWYGIIMSSSQSPKRSQWSRVLFLSAPLLSQQGSPLFDSSTCTRAYHQYRVAKCHMTMLQHR